MGRWPPIEDLIADSTALLSKPTIATTIVMCLSVLIGFCWHSTERDEKKGTGKSWALREFTRESVGTVVMVCCCFPPGPFLGHLPGYEEWLAHAAGVLLADKLCGGPHVNPAVSFAFFVWRKLTLAQVAVLVAGQLLGGALAFPLLQACAAPYGVTIGGPAVGAGVALSEACWAEFWATFVLLAAVFVLCTTWLGSYWPIRMPLVAATIRLICVGNGGATGPAMNPTIATTWALFSEHGSDRYPGMSPASLAEGESEVEHYAVYWLSSLAGGAAAALLWSLIWRDGVFAPLTAPSSSSSSSSSKKAESKKTK